MKKSLSHLLPIVALGCSAVLFAATSCSRAPETPPKSVEMTGDDNMKFNVTEFDIARGQKVTITLKNIGTAPKASMGHNVVVLNKGVNWQKYVEDASMAASEDYVPAASKKDVIANTKLLGPAETDSVTFTAPHVPGPYDFVCSFPGHATQGMKGVMTVN